MNVIKFCGKNKTDSIKKAVSFFYDNQELGTLEIFLAKCRIQADGITVHFYPNLNVNNEELIGFKKRKKKQ